MRYPFLAALACGALAFGVAACGDDDSDSGSGSSSGGDLSGAVAIDGSSTVFPFAPGSGRGLPGREPGRQGHGRRVRHRRRLREVLRRRDRHRRRLAPDRRGRGSSRLREERHQLHAGPGRQRRHRRRLQPGAEDRVPDDRSAQVALEEGLERHQLRRSSADGIPDGKVSLYGPGTDSGTFDFFTEEINGEKGDTRTDYQPSEDDNVLVQGVEGDKTATRLLRLLVLRGQRRQAEPDRGRQRRRLRQAVQGDDPGRHATSRSRARCSCTRATSR